MRCCVRSALISGLFLLALSCGGSQSGLGSRDDQAVIDVGRLSKATFSQGEGEIVIRPLGSELEISVRSSTSSSLTIDLEEAKDYVFESYLNNNEYFKTIIPKEKVEKALLEGEDINLGKVNALTTYLCDHVINTAVQAKDSDLELESVDVDAIMSQFIGQGHDWSDLGLTKHDYALTADDAENINSLIVLQSSIDLASSGNLSHRTIISQIRSGEQNRSQLKEHFDGFSASDWDRVESVSSLLLGEQAQVFYDEITPVFLDEETPPVDDTTTEGDSDENDGEEGNVVEGVIRNTSGQPIANVLIQLIAEDGVTVFASQMTTEAGGYRFNQVPTGTYWLSVKADDFKQQSQKITVN